MKLTINGKEKFFDNGLTVSDLIDVIDVDVRKVAIELNLEIVPKSDFDNVYLVDGDKLEIVHFIGGG